MRKGEGSKVEQRTHIAKTVAWLDGSDQSQKYTCQTEGADVESTLRLEGQTIHHRTQQRSCHVVFEELGELFVFCRRVPRVAVPLDEVADDAQGPLFELPPGPRFSLLDVGGLVEGFKVLGSFGKDLYVGGWVGEGENKGGGVRE